MLVSHPIVTSHVTVWSHDIVVSHVNVLVPVTAIFHPIVASVPTCNSPADLRSACV